MNEGQAETDEDEAQIGLPVDNDIAESDKVQAEDNHLQVLLLRKQAIISLQGMAKKRLWLNKYLLRNVLFNF